MELQGSSAMPSQTSPRAGRARQLRRDGTVVEQRLWYHLRNRQLAGIKFRRQEPLGVFIVDFCSLDAKLVIELDGGQHAEHLAADAERTTALERMGYRVLRFWNNEVVENLDSVLERIAAIASAPVAAPEKKGEKKSSDPLT